MVYVTVVIPIGEGHLDIADRAIDSVRQQTEPCGVLYEVDTAHDGPGAVRNRLLAQVTTPFVVFLDADDWIAPTFVAEALKIVRRTGKYVYTDWMMGATPTPAPEKAWCGGSWHPITALIPTAWARAVGGFDEHLPAMEDTDFYMKLVTRQYCGIRLPLALFTYSDDGLRSDELRSDPLVYAAIKEEVSRRYAGMAGCCGDDALALPPVGERMDGDVLCQALWNGKHTEASEAQPGRIYPRIAAPSRTWVNIADARARPTLWRIVEQTVDEAQPMNGLDALDLAQEIARRESAPPAVAPYEPPPVEPVPAKPDIAKIKQLGAKRIRK